MERSIDDIEDDLDRLQEAYLEEEDDEAQIHLSLKFSYLLQEATDADGVDRLAASVTIHNWVRLTSRRSL